MDTKYVINLRLEVIAGHDTDVEALKHDISEGIPAMDSNLNEITIASIGVESTLL